MDFFIRHFAVVGSLMVIVAVVISFLRFYREERKVSKIAELGGVAPRSYLFDFFRDKRRESEIAEPGVEVPRSYLFSLLDFKKKPGQHLAVRLSAKSPFVTSSIKFLVPGMFITGFAILMLFHFEADDFVSIMILPLVPVILVGLWMLYAAVRRIFNWFMSGKTIVELSQEPLEVGQYARAFVIQSGRKNVHDFKVALTCRQRITRISSGRHSRGVDLINIMVKAPIVYEEILHHQRDFRIDEPLQLDIAFRIPPEARPSHHGGSGITWGIEVTLEGTWVPEFEVLFPLRVLPAGMFDSGIFDL